MLWLYAFPSISILVLLANCYNITTKLNVKIIGGIPVQISSYPFMLSLNHKNYGFQCGAVILSRTIAVTALHCVDSNRARNFFVRAGSRRVDAEGTVHRVSKIYVYNDSLIHAEFGLFLNDIALLEVKQPFKFSRNIQPIKLPNPRVTDTPNTLLASGWGSTTYPELVRIFAHSENVLQSVKLNYVPYEECIKKGQFFESFVHKDRHYCFDGRKKDTCFGDSGGPLSDRETLYGIVSFGNHCGIFPGVYVKVSYYHRWIMSVLRKNSKLFPIN